MNKIKTATCHHYGWLDSFAISMSVICAIHCLVTPILLVLVPILATTFWVHEDFHLWMIGLVIPTTSIAVFSGCRRHKDKLVLCLSMTGLLILLSIALYGSFFHSSCVSAGHSHCPHCFQRESGSAFNISNMLNVFGGALLASGHIRNFLLCRRSDCHHE